MTKKKRKVLKKADVDDPGAPQEEGNAELMPRRSDADDTPIQDKSVVTAVRRVKKKEKRVLEGQANAKSEKGQQECANDVSNRIFIANLPLSTSAQEFRDVFEQFGVVEAAKLSVKGNGDCRGVGFVTFKTSEEAERALQANGMSFKSQALRIEKANPPGVQVVNEVFVGKLPLSTEEKKLRRHFKACGEIKSVRMNIDLSKRKFNGTAFLKFTTFVAAKAAIKLDGSDFAGQKISVKPALPKKKDSQAPPEVDAGQPKMKRRK